MLQAARDASRDGAEQMQVGDQRVRRRGLGSEARPCVIVGDPQYVGSVSTSSREASAPVTYLIEPSDLPRGRSMRGDDVGQPHTVGGVGARHGDEVAHGGVGDETTILHVLLDCLGQCAHGLRRRDTQLTLRSKRCAKASSAKPCCSCNVRSSQPCSNALSVASVCRRCRKMSASASGISHTTAATVSRCNRRRQRTRLWPSTTT